MSADGRIERDVVARQAAMFGHFVGQGLYTTRAALAAASGIHPSTLSSWAQGAAMPLHAVLTLARFLPREAINMLTEPAGLRLVDIEGSKTNWGHVAAATAGLVADICEAGSDGQYDHTEVARLQGKAKQVIVVLTGATEEN
jgi:hypothetical protein